MPRRVGEPSPVQYAVALVVGTAIAAVISTTVNWLIEGDNWLDVLWPENVVTGFVVTVALLAWARYVRMGRRPDDAGR